LSFPKTLLQAIANMLMPLIPHLDDYSCFICTGVAFKPIRLNCGHVFCVRCLVKIQKRGIDACPMCRTACVLSANKGKYSTPPFFFIITLMRPPQRM
jgi:hypothetical protein